MHWFHNPHNNLESQQQFAQCSTVSYLDGTDIQVQYPTAELYPKFPIKCLLKKGGPGIQMHLLSQGGRCYSLITHLTKGESFFTF